MSQPMLLTGTRRALLRSLYVAVFTASLTALVMCVLPGYQTVYVASGAQVESAGGPLLALAMIAATCLAGIGLALPRREISVLASGALTVLSMPIIVWLVIRAADASEGLETHALWPARVLDLSLPIVIVAGPILAACNALLFYLEARSSPSTIPVATAR